MYFKKHSILFDTLIELAKALDDYKTAKRLKAVKGNLETIQDKIDRTMPDIPQKYFDFVRETYYNLHSFYQKQLKDVLEYYQII